MRAIRQLTRLAITTLALAVCACGDGSAGNPDAGPGGDGGGPDGGLPDGSGPTWDAPPAPDAMVCADVSVALTQQTPTVFLVIDRSGSMSNAFSGTTRWQAVHDTLLDPQSGIVPALASEVRFGMALYRSNATMCPIVDSVPPALDNYAPMEALFSSASPSGNTPTGEALEQVTPMLTAVTEPGPKIVVLATDGEPDTCADPTGESGQPEAIAAVEDAFVSGINTFIVSVGNDVSDAHLQDMANAGAGLPVGGTTNAPFYKALNTTALVDAFEQIIYGSRTCTYTLNGMINPTFADQGVVVLNGTTLTHGTDWTLTDSTTLVLMGSACDQILAGGDHTLEATFPCEAVVE